MIRQESRWWHLLRVLKGTVTGLGLLVLIITFTPIDSWWARMLAEEGYHRDGDALIVLSGASSGDGWMDWNSYLCTCYASQGYRAGDFMVRQGSRWWHLLRVLKGTVTGLGLLVLIITFTPIDSW